MVPGPNRIWSVRLPLHVLEDGVAVALAAGERQQDVDDGGGERRHVSATDISVTEIVVKWCGALLVAEKRDSNGLANSEVNAVRSRQL